MIIQTIRAGRALLSVHAGSGFGFTNTARAFTDRPHAQIELAGVVVVAIIIRQTLAVVALSVFTLAVVGVDAGSGMRITHTASGFAAEFLAQGCFAYAAISVAKEPFQAGGLFGCGGAHTVVNALTAFRATQSALTRQRSANIQGALTVGAALIVLDAIRSAFAGAFVDAFTVPANTRGARHTFTRRAIRLVTGRVATARADRGHREHHPQNNKPPPDQSTF